jgi:hypothetical protein
MLTATVGAATTTSVVVGGLTEGRREARIGSGSAYSGMLTATVGAATTTSVAVGGLTGERREARIGSESAYSGIAARCFADCVQGARGNASRCKAGLKIQTQTRTRTRSWCWPACTR